MNYIEAVKLCANGIKVTHSNYPNYYLKNNKCPVLVSTCRNGCDKYISINRDLIISDNWQEDKDWNLAEQKITLGYHGYHQTKVKKCRDLIIERFNYKMFTSTAQYVDVVLKTFGDLDGKK